MRYLIKFSYDGALFYGYQKQPNKRTVEGEVEKALYNINDHTETRIFSSGRTDRGVHALGQMAHFDLDVDITLYKLKCALNSLLPEDIHVIEAQTVEDDFHARFMAKKKTYQYYLNMGEYSPINRNHVYQYNKSLNVEKMQEAVKYFMGEHDFKVFTSPEVLKPSYLRTISRADISVDNNIVTFTFSGNGFMKYQIRNMVGTLIKIGKEKLPPTIIKDIFVDNTLGKHITTAPSCGLYLKEVIYEE